MSAVNHPVAGSSPAQGGCRSEKGRMDGIGLENQRLSTKKWLLLKVLPLARSLFLLTSGSLGSRFELFWSGLTQTEIISVYRQIYFPQRVALAFAGSGRDSNSDGPRFLRVLNKRSLFRSLFVVRNLIYHGRFPIDVNFRCQFLPGAMNWSLNSCVDRTSTSSGSREMSRRGNPSSTQPTRMSTAFCRSPIET